MYGALRTLIELVSRMLQRKGSRVPALRKEASPNPVNIVPLRTSYLIKLDRLTGVIMEL